MKSSFRWYGDSDLVTLDKIRQIPGMRSIVSAVYDVKPGEVWGGGMVSEPGALAERLHAVNVQRVAQEGSEHAHGIAAAAHTGAHGVRKQSGHFQELFPPEELGKRASPGRGALFVSVRTYLECFLKKKYCGS